MRALGLVVAESFGLRLRPEYCSRVGSYSCGTRGLATLKVCLPSHGLRLKGLSLVVAEETLKQLHVTQRNKIEEIKKKTNCYSTKNLIDRYDEPRRVRLHV